MEMLFVGLLSVLYGILISFGYGKRLDDNIVTRPFVVVVGVVIVLAGYAWEQKSIEVFWEQLKWFCVGGIPMILRTSLLFVHQQAQEEKKQEKLQNDIDRYTQRGTDAEANGD